MGSPLQSAAQNAARALWQLAQEPLPDVAARAMEMAATARANTLATNNTSTHNNIPVVSQEAVHTPADTAPSTEPPRDAVLQEDASRPATTVLEPDRGATKDGAVVGHEPAPTPQPVENTPITTNPQPQEPEELEGDEALVLHLSHPAREPEVEALRNASREPATVKPDTSQDEAIARALGEGADTGPIASSSSDVTAADTRKPDHKSEHHVHGHHPRNCRRHGHSHGHGHSHSHSHARGHHKHHGHSVKSR